MKSNNILKNKKQTFLIKAKGKTKQELFQNAFDQMKVAAYKSSNNLIISLKTIEVRVIGEISFETLSKKSNIEIEIDVEIQFLNI